MITEAIEILSKREDLYNSIVKAAIFEELNAKFLSKCLSELILDRKSGTWGEVFLKDGQQVKVLRSQDIRHGFIDYAQAESRYVSVDDFAKNKLIEGDILVIKSNGSEDLVGKSQIFNIQNEDVIPSNFLMKIRPNKTLILPEYLDIFLKSPQALQWRVNKQSTTTGLRNLDTDGYLSVEVPLPNLKEQKEVVTIYKKLLKGFFDFRTVLVNVNRFEKYKSFCDSLKKLETCFNEQQSYLQLLRQTILQEAVQGKLTKQDANNEPASELLKRIKAEKQKLIKEGKLKKEKELTPITEDEIPFELPKGWVWCRVEDIATVKVGSTPSRSESRYWGGDIPWVSSGEVANNFVAGTKERITEKALKETSVFLYPINTVLIAMIGQGKTRGQTSILRIPATTNQNVAGCIISHGLVIPEYLWFYFLSTYENNRGSARGGNQPALNGQIVKQMLCPLSPLPEQQRIVAKVQQLQQQLNALEKQVQQSNRYAQQLLQALLKEAFEVHKKEYAISGQLTMAAEE
jgi:type I restriction enzyme S subunit